MASGKVKFYNGAKGFGFITDDSTSKDVFVHMSGIKDQIREGDAVTFDIEQGQKGPTATNVRLS
jgi:CspA family cold shock protein